MRLLVVSSWFPYPLDNGSRLRIYHLLEALGRIHEITLLTVGRREGDERIDPLLRFCRAVHVVRPQPPQPLRVGALFSATPRHYAQALSNELVSLINVHAPTHDVVMAMQIYAAVHVVAARQQTPALFEEVELGAARVPESGGERASLPRRVRHQLTWWKHRRYLRHLLQHVHVATVVSSTERAQLIELGYPADRISVVPNAVVVPESVDVRLERRRQIIYPGSVTFSANLDAVQFFIRDVWPDIRERHPDVEFVITGQTGDVDVSGLAGVDGVRLTGFVEDVAPLIAESLACVVPLRTGGGTRLKVLQAMALGTPVISTSKGVEGLDVHPDEHFILGDTPAALVEGVQRLRDDAALGERLASAARERVRALYTWDQSAALLAEQLNRVAAAGRGRTPSQRAATRP